MNSQARYVGLLRYCLLGGMFLVPLIPFLVSSSFFFPFITTKNFTFRILVEVLLALWLTLILFDRSYLPKFSWLLVSVASFVGIIAVADIFGVYPYKSIWSNFERMEGLVTLLHLLAYSIVLASVIKTEKIWTYLFHTSIVASLIMGVYGLAQLFGAATIHQGSARLDASLGNATYLAIYMLIHMFLTSFYLVKLVQKEGSQNRKGGEFYGKVVFYVLTIAFQFFILYHTATRGALIGLFVGAFVTACLIAIFGEKKTILKKGAITVIAFVLIVVGGFFAIKETSFVKNSPVLARFSSISLSETTTKSRFLIWNMALQGAKERPILGWGQENFNYVFNKYYSPQMYNQEQWFDRTHNVILDWLIAGGILGLLGYLSMFFFLLYYVWFAKKEELGVVGLVKDSFNKIFRRSTYLSVNAEGSEFSLVEKAVLSGLFIAYFIHNLFVFDNLVSYILFFTVLAYVASRVGSPTALATTSKKEVKEPVLYASIASIVVVFCLVFYFVNVPALKASGGLIAALQAQSASGPEKNLELMQEVIGYGSFGTPEAREQLIQLTIQVVGSQGVSNEIKQKFATFTSDQLKAQTELTPLDARYLLFYGIFLSQLGSTDASTYLLKALEKSPKKQSIIFEIVSDNLRLRKYNEALVFAKQAYDLAPEYTEATKIYALTAVYAGQQELANKLLESLPENERVFDDRFLQAFVVVKQYDQAVALLQAKIAQDPNNFQNRISAAQIYLQMNYREQAIKEIQAAVTLNPSIKTQADAYINDIRSGKVTQ